jgi:glycosyltransferase involved in cell wall biosynthesis
MPHRRCLLFVMNRWGSVAGGIQTVNREIACAVADHAAPIDCVAIVTFATDKERSHAKACGIRLVEGHTENDWSSAILSPELKNIPPESVVAVVGHSYFSGSQAIDLRDRFFPSAKAIHFVHMSPLDTEALKEYREDDYVKEREQRIADELRIAQRADVVACVGPRLWRYMKDQFAAKRQRTMVARIDCGMRPPGEERERPIQPTLLCLGRTDSLNVKGIDIFARAAGHLTCMWSEDPATQHRTVRPRFIVRGAKGDAEGLERRLIELSRLAGAEAAIRVRPYTTDPEELEADYCGASIFVMPSREEGFGLVACDAISLGVPVLISAASGLAEAIREMARKHHMRIDDCVIEHAENIDATAIRYAKAAMHILVDQDAASDYTQRLLDNLLPSCSWEAAAKQILKLVDATDLSAERESAVSTNSDGEETLGQTGGGEKHSTAVDPHDRLLAVLADTPRLHTAALEVLYSPKYPRMMALEDRLVQNPVWNGNALAATTENRSISDRLRGHMFLAVAEPLGMNPHLYCYRSDRWNAYLLPFFKHEYENGRAASPHLAAEEHVARRYFSHAIPTSKFVVSVKRNEEHPEEWWLYAFEFYNLILPADFQFSDNHRWLDLERLSNPDYREAAVNGDVIRTIRSYFGTGLHGLERSPVTINEVFLGDS